MSGLFGTLAGLCIIGLAFTKNPVDSIHAAACAVTCALLSIAFAIKERK
jgi:hypothetical protein